MDKRKHGDQEYFQQQPQVINIVQKQSAGGSCLQSIGGCVVTVIIAIIILLFLCSSGARVAAGTERFFPPDANACYTNNSWSRGHWQFKHPLSEYCVKGTDDYKHAYYLALIGTVRDGEIQLKHGWSPFCEAWNHFERKPSTQGLFQGFIKRLWKREDLNIPVPHNWVGCITWQLPPQG